MSEEQIPKKYAVPALEKSVSIFMYLAEHEKGRALSNISHDLNIPKTSVFAILNTLEDHNLLRRSIGGLYTLGLRFFSLGMSAYKNLDINAIIIPYLERMRDETGFTVHLSNHDNGEQICLAKIEGKGMIRFNSYVGQRKKMNTTACGKAIAAYLPEYELQKVIDKGFDIYTAYSISSESVFRSHLIDIRKSGFAVDDEEGELGVRCVGVPIFMDGGELFGSISLSTLKNNLSMQALQELSIKLLAVGGQISKELGYVGPYPLSV